MIQGSLERTVSHLKHLQPEFPPQTHALIPVIEHRHHVVPTAGMLVEHLQFHDPVLPGIPGLPHVQLEHARVGFDVLADPLIGVFAAGIRPAATAAKPLDNACPGWTAVECRPSARTAMDGPGRPA